ncbi:DUF2255 family protein [Agromyces seonyuensis]|uniref:DUF2255 family protein n=1 Tax=Agromyces seonyuensis TaxID=2662446 RepID=A0A6I4P3M2_9MICO|nr:DUF2255 family protein [Agromyces seonyuensis]MWB97834.1 DUF2255 family protein [Agromyces seonyuensis]
MSDVGGGSSGRTRWTGPELGAFQAAFSLHLTAGASGPDAPEVEIGMVVSGGEVYVRAQRGIASQWYRASKRHGSGRVRLGDVSFDVLLSDAAPSALPAIDDAYRRKYGGLASFGPGARAATLRLDPRRPAGAI